MERAIASGILSKAKVAAPSDTTNAIRLADLSQAITALVADLERVALTKTPTSLPRRISRAFNASDRPEDRGEQRAPRSQAL